jgi:hypothetical protein
MKMFVGLGKILFTRHSQNSFGVENATGDQ